MRDAEECIQAQRGKGMHKGRKWATLLDSMRSFYAFNSGSWGARLCPRCGELAKMTMGPEIEGQLRVKIQELSILASLLGAAR
jgi:hypothetical protein